MQLWHFWCNIVSSKLQRENKHRLIEPSTEYHLKWVTISNSASKSVRAQPFIHIEPHWSLFLGKCPITLQLSLELPKNYWDTSGLENEKKKIPDFLNRHCRTIWMTSRGKPYHSLSLNIESLPFWWKHHFMTQVLLLEGASWDQLCLSCVT